MAINKVQYGNTTLIDLTDTTAVASDVAQGKYFYGKDGVKTLGTASGGGTGGNVWQDENGYVHLDDEAPSGQITVESLSVTQNGTYTAPTGKAYSPVTVNVSGRGGLEYESGTWTPSEDVARGEISFTNTHTDAPFFVVITDQTGTYDSTTNSNYEMTFVSWSWAFGSGMYFSSAGRWFAGVRYTYRGTGTTQLLTNYVNIIRESGNTNYQYPGYWVDNEKFYPYTDSTSRYWRAGRTYKWIAVWKPTP